MAEIMETTPEMDLDIELINGLDDPTPVNEPLPIDDFRSGTGPIVGFLSFEFYSNPLLGLRKVVIASLIYSVTILCHTNWLTELRYHVKNLKITKLYVQNTFHFKFVEPFLPDGIVYHSYRRPRLNRCKSLFVQCSRYHVPKARPSKRKMQMKVCTVESLPKRKDWKYPSFHDNDPNASGHASSNYEKNAKCILMRSPVLYIRGTVNIQRPAFCGDNMTISIVSPVVGFLKVVIHVKPVKSHRKCRSGRGSPVVRYRIVACLSRVRSKYHKRPAVKDSEHVKPVKSHRKCRSGRGSPVVRYRIVACLSRVRSKYHKRPAVKDSEHVKPVKSHRKCRSGRGSPVVRYRIVACLSRVRSKYHKRPAVKDSEHVKPVKSHRKCRSGRGSLRKCRSGRGSPVVRYRIVACLSRVRSKYHKRPAVKEREHVKPVKSHRNCRSGRGSPVVRYRIVACLSRVRSKYHKRPAVKDSEHVQPVKSHRKVSAFF
ncbi:hypothetical protein TNCV_3226341 [Trichonephila clavipes]|nr:hypothetical protein TNCV_3226341 [Trichonephila clavipes]